MMSSKYIHIIIISLALLFTVSPAIAGTPVYGEGPDLEKAIEAATKAVEEAAKRANRCVSKYPSIDTCEKLPNGNWRCRGIRANQKGSCD